MQTLITLPHEFMAMYNTLSSLPPHDSSTADQLAPPISEPGKRPWETSKTGYLNWAIEQLISRAKDRGQGEGSSAIGTIASAAFGTAPPEDVKGLLDALSSSSPGEAENNMDVDS